MTNLALSAEALLASLMAQAEGRGADLITMRALVEESSRRGRGERWRRWAWMMRAHGGTWMSCASYSVPGAMRSGALGGRW